MKAAIPRSMHRRMMSMQKLRLDLNYYQIESNEVNYIKMRLVSTSISEECMCYITFVTVSLSLTLVLFKSVAALSI